jgi:hypothetical protein
MNPNKKRLILAYNIKQLMAVVVLVVATALICFTALTFVTPEKQSFMIFRMVFADGDMNYFNTTRHYILLGGALLMISGAILAIHAERFKRQNLSGIDDEEE